MVVCREWPNCQKSFATLGSVRTHIANMLKKEGSCSKTQRIDIKGDRACEPMTGKIKCGVCGGLYKDIDRSRTI